MTDVLRWRDYAAPEQTIVCELLARYGLSVQLINLTEAIPGSYWGDEETGLIANTLYIRSDTPVHSLLHEACHYICMDSERRSTLHTDAGGTDQEENAVCYLQIVLSDFCPAFGRQRMWRDMDQWGYSFREGSAQAWFECDAADDKQWLLSAKLLDEEEQPVWRVRE